MKTKNNLTKGILIGIGIIVLPLILMSTTYTGEQQNKFEFCKGSDDGTYNYLLNTETGDIYKLGFMNGHKMKKVEIN